MVVDPGNPTGFYIYDRTLFSTATPTAPFDYRWRFWERTKARLAQRRRERQEQRDREDMDIAAWLAQKAPTRTEVIAQGTIDGIRFYPTDNEDAHAIVDETGYAWRFFDPRGLMALAEGETSVLELLAGGNEAVAPTRISSARRGMSREFVCTRIQRMTVPVEPEWDVPTMIDAHRNGATALERPLTIDEQCESPVWEELVEQMWDPTHERGPRERDWVRRQHKRRQPSKQSRAERKGKR